jgi:hypothetical protein
MIYSLVKSRVGGSMVKSIRRGLMDLYRERWICSRMVSFLEVLILGPTVMEEVEASGVTGLLLGTMRWLGDFSGVLVVDGQVNPF